MKFSYNWIKELSGVDKTPHEMAEMLTMHSFQVDSVDPSGDDSILNIDVLPNRTHDCLSHAGVAKEVALLMGMPLARDPQAADVAVEESGAARADEMLSVAIEDAGSCTRYSARVISNVTVGPSPEWMVRRLEASGLRSINNIVDATNYVMLELGQPLHAFDYDKIQNSKIKNQNDNAKFKNIIVRKAKSGERFTTIDGKELLLDASMLVIADETHPIALAGIKGGADSAVDADTSTIIIESANFEAVGVARTSRKIGLATDASVRFAAGLDPNLTTSALNRAAVLIAEIAGGTVLQGIINVYPAPVAAKPIVLECSAVHRLLGIEMSREKIASILESIGCVISGHRMWLSENSSFPQSLRGSRANQEEGIGATSDVQTLMVTPPTVRLDLITPEDLIEEIGRIIGYENIPPAMPVSVIVPAGAAEEIVFADRIRDALAAAGMAESYNYSLIADPGVADGLTLENPMSDRRNYLRPSLLPGLIKNAHDNMRFFDDVRVFEIGRIFANNKRQTAKGGERYNDFAGHLRSVLGDSPVNERLSVGAILARKGAKHDDLFYELKGVFGALCERLRVGEAWFDDYKATPEPGTIPGIWDEPRTAEIKIGDTEVGYLGVIRQTERFAAAAFEFDMGMLLAIGRSEQEFQPIPKYPSVMRDISILVDPDMRISSVENAIENSGARYIKDVDLFDMFEPNDEGQAVKNGMAQKSLAFHIIYQADDHTLTDEEVNSEHAKVEQALRAKLDAWIR